MINLLATQPLTPAASANSFDAFCHLLHLIGDPSAAARRLQELVDAGLKANEAILAADEALKNLEAARKLHEETLRRERQEHQQKITQANAEIASKDEQVNSELSERLRSVQALETKAAADAKAAAELSADLQRRLKVIQSASADLKGAA